MSKIKLIITVLAIFLVLGIVPMALGAKGDVPPEKADSVGAAVGTGTLSNVKVKVVDNRDSTGMLSVILYNSAGQSLGWYWIKASTVAGEDEVFTACCTAKITQSYCNVYTDANNRIYRVMVL